MSAGLPPVQAAHLFPLECEHNEDAREGAGSADTKSIKPYSTPGVIKPCTAEGSFLGLCVRV